MSDNSPQGTDTVSVEPKPNKFNKIFFAVLAATIVVIALSVTLVSTSWTSYGDAKSEVAAAESNLTKANTRLSSANAQYSIAVSDYASWYSCYLTTSWYWDWICGNEANVTSALTIAESQVESAKAGMKQARTRVATAESDLDKAAEQFNQTVWIWGALSGVALISLIVVGVLAARKRKTQRKLEEDESRPDWDCPECSTHNEGGMFCVGCGFSKADAKALAKQTTAEEVTEPEA